jgi:hypothetical protein
VAVKPANAHELAESAGALGADVFSDDMCYPLDSGGWLPSGTLPESTIIPTRTPRHTILFVAWTVVEPAGGRSPLPSPPSAKAPG